MQYSKEHINKCAGCPKMEGCRMLEMSFGVRVHYCYDLRKYAPKIDAIISRLDNRFKAMFKDDPIIGYMANKEKDLSKHYTPEAIEAGKRRYDRNKHPNDYLSLEILKELSIVYLN